MAQSVTIAPRIPLSAPDMPQYDSRSGASANRAFGAVQEMAQGIQRLEDGAIRADAMKGIAVTKQTLSNGIKELNLTTPNPDEFRAQADQWRQDTYDRAVAGYTNPRAAQLFKDNMAAELVEYQGEVNRGYIARRGIKAKADTDVGMEQLVNASKTATPENLASIDQMARDLQSNLAIAGIQEPKASIDAVQKFRVDVDNARAGEMLFKNPRLLKAIVESEEGKKQFPWLKAEQLYAWGQKATELMKEREQEGNKAEKDRVEKVNMDMLLRITKPGASLVAERESVRQLGAQGKISAKDTEHWIDNIDKMVKASQKEPKEVDPFKTSNSVTLAQVMSGVINNPEAWDSEKITALMGNGLSVPHALRAVAMLDKANKDPAGTLTPMKQAQQTWSNLQSSLSFIPSDQRLRNDPEARLTNNREAQRIFDQMQVRADKGEDPRVVLEELMQPHYDEKIKSWFDTLRSGPLNPFGMAFGVPPSREEGVKAKQELIRRGLQPTEDAVKKEVEIRRRLTSPDAAPSAPARGGEAAALDRTQVLERRVQELQKELIEKGFKPKEY